jgi:hypothetical protein
VEGAHLLLLLNLTSDGATRSRYRPLGRGATAGIMRPPLEQRRFISSACMRVETRSSLLADQETH